MSKPTLKALGWVPHQPRTGWYRTSSGTGIDQPMWMVSPKNIEAMDRVPMINIPLVLASASFDKNDELRGTSHLGGGTYSRQFWNAVAVPYLSMRMQLGI